MLYNLYTKKRHNVTDEIEGQWFKLLFDSPMSVVEDFMTNLCESNNIYIDDYEMVILPNIYSGDRVLNTITQEIGEVDTPGVEYITVKNIINKRPTDINQDVYKWKTSDTIVLNR